MEGDNMDDTITPRDIGEDADAWTDDDQGEWLGPGDPPDDNMSAFTKDDPFVSTRTDAEGNRWWFRYEGGTSVRIRPAGTDGWTHQIVLGFYDMRPANVTREWLQERATAWIEQYNEDVADGQI